MRSEFAPLTDQAVCDSTKVRATGSINLNLTQVLELGHTWSSDALVTFAGSLLQTATNANAGTLKGNRMFFTNDYMVGPL